MMRLQHSVEIWLAVQHSVKSTDWLILENNEKAILNSNMSYTGSICGDLLCKSISYLTMGRGHTHSFSSILILLCTKDALFALNLNLSMNF